eukprot:3848778-Rhodomonas_salina.2
MSAVDALWLLAASEPAFDGSVQRTRLMRATTGSVAVYADRESRQTPRRHAWCHHPLRQHGT